MTPLLLRVSHSPCWRFVNPVAAVGVSSPTRALWSQLLDAEPQRPALTTRRRGSGRVVGVESCLGQPAEFWRRDPWFSGLSVWHCSVWLAAVFQRVGRLHGTLFEAVRGHAAEAGAWH
jgi:hypothetical protein